MLKTRLIIDEFHYFTECTPWLRRLESLFREKVLVDEGGVVEVQHEVEAVEVEEPLKLHVGQSAPPIHVQIVEHLVQRVL